VTPSRLQRRRVSRHRAASPHHQLDVSDTSSVTMSNEFIEEAEVLLHADLDGSSPAAPATDLSSGFDAEAVQNLSWPRDAAALSPIQRTNSDSFLERRRQFYGSVQREESVLSTQPGGSSRLSDAEVPQILREASMAAPEPEPTSNSLTWRYWYDGQCAAEIN